VNAIASEAGERKHKPECRNIEMEPPKVWVIDTNEPVSREQLEELGVFERTINADDYDQELDQICKERNYAHRSIITISKETMPDLEQKLNQFFEEHLHEFEEIRFFLEGSGYFDVRDKKDRWVRIHLKKNHLIVLPAGIYHRFTLDENRYAKVMRLFVAEQKEPVWTPFNRANQTTEEMKARQHYVETYLSK